MHHRLCIVLAILCVVSGGTGCSSINQQPAGEQILLPRQTGSTLQRRVMVPSGSGATSAPQKKKQPKKASTKKEPKKEEAKRKAPTPTPAPKQPKPTPEEETPPPDRFR